MNSDFEPPPKGLSILATAGGVVTAVVAIAGLQYWSSNLTKAASAPKPQATTTSTPSTSPPSPTGDTEAQKALAKVVEQKAAACKFDQSFTPNRGINFELKTFYSKAMGQKRAYGLILPPGYQTNPKQSYPVIFLLHGGHGDAGGLQTCAAVTEVLYKLYSSGELPPAIVITPDGNDKQGASPDWDSQYFHGPNGQVATLIGSDLVQEVKSRYRVLNDPQFWAMGGVSSGGWGAFNIGLRYLDRFNILFSHSGYFTDSSGSDNSPINLVQKLSSQQRSSLKIYLDAGVKDEEFLEETAQFHQKLVSLGIVSRFNVFDGGHGTTGGDTGWHYWHKHLEDSLSYVGTQWKSTPTKENSKP
jgi:enterochelin esterase-like enzyme